LTAPRTPRQKRDDDRIYSSARWRRLRRQKLAASPLCEACRAETGRVVVATVVDHRKPVRLGGDPFPPLSGLRSLCWPCHSAKTARGPEAGAVRTSKPRKGCNPDGSPIDPAHPWHDAQGSGGTSAVDMDGACYAAGDHRKYLITKDGADG
jgi:5-methylcytosine-specific restriction protein A